MASYEALTFSPSVFQDKMLAMCDKALLEAVGAIMSNEYFYNGTLRVVNDYEGFDGHVTVTAGDLKAWIVEYGQGEAADTVRNPYWKDYVQSGYTHRSRQNGTVLRRGAGSYESINFEKNTIVQHDSGSEPSGTPVSNALQRALSREPKPFLQELLQEAFRAFESSFNSQLQSFDISSCFVKSQINV